MISTIILGILLDGDYTVYEIKKIIEKGIGIFYKASFGSLYPAVSKLLEKGYVTVNQDQEIYRKKKIYKITNSGTAAFMDWLEAPLDITDPDTSRLSKIYFFDKLAPENREQQLSEYEWNSKQYLKKLQDIEQQLVVQEDIDKHYYKLSTLYYGICVMQQTIKWCQSLRKQESLKNLMD
ncbi:MAG: PadR family transcriptional regulator [Lachnospiraceae bacterium]